jgi:hypothetical protein
VFENIGVDDVDVRLRGEALAQRLDQAVVQFDGGKTADAFRQRSGKHAFARADLQHRVRWRQFRGVQDRRQIAAVAQKILTE